jgi:anti-anti-sigma regulatory factor
MGTLLHTSSTHHCHHVAIVRLPSSLFTPAALDDALAQAIVEAERYEDDAIVLDFRAVDDLTESGLALVVELRERARVNGRRLLVCGLEEYDADRLRIHGLAGSIFPDPAAAVEDELAFRREVLCCA